MAMSDRDAMRPMWHCPECGKPFANRNSSHSCVRIPLDSQFIGGWASWAPSVAGREHRPPR